MQFRLRTRARCAACSLGVAALCGIIAAPAHADPLPTPAPSPSPTAIGRVFTSDRSLEATSNTTRPTFVVDRASIEANGWRTIGAALTNVPGVNLASYGAFGAQVNYGIRGTTSSETLVLQDGVPIASGSNGTVDLGSLSTVGVARIEVVESAASTLYGSDATGGVINIITTGAAPQPYARVSGGTFSDWDFAAVAGTRDLAVSFERHTAANIYDYPAFNYPGAGNATAAGTRTNADAQQTVLRLSYIAQLGGGWSAHLTGGDNTINIGVPGGLSFLTADARQGTNRTDALLDLAHAAGAGRFDVMLSGVAQKLPYLDVPDSGGESDTFDGRTQASLRYSATGSRTDIVTGIDVARETAELTFAPFYQPPAELSAGQSQAAAYAQAGYDPAPWLRLLAGLRGETDGPQGSVAAPSVGFALKGRAVRLTANISESFQAPTLIDLYYPGFSNPNLVPEKLTNYDATFAFPHIAGGLSLGYFGRNGSNLIVSAPPAYVPYNASQVSISGLQMSLATLPFHHISATLSLTNVYRALNTGTGIALPNTQPIVATVGLERPFDGGPVAFGATIRVVGTSADVPNPADPNGPALADPYSSYTLAGAYLRYRFAPSLILTVRGQNIGNELSAPIYGYPAPGRSLQVELATR